MAVVGELLSGLGEDDNWLLAYDASTEFLTTADVLCAADDPAHTLLCHGSKLSSAPTCSGANKVRGRALHSNHVSALRQEIDGLHQRLKRLHQDLGGKSPSRQTNWKLRAASEQMMREHTVDQNRRLEKCVAANEAFVQSVRHLLDKQSGAVVTEGPRISIALGDDGSRVYGMLSAVLNARQYQLEASMRRRLQDISHMCITSSQDTAREWHVKKLGRGLILELSKSALLPFTAAEYVRIVSQYTKLDKTQRIHGHVRACRRPILLINHWILTVWFTGSGC